MGLSNLTVPRIAILLSLLFFLTATAYSLFIPIFEASDETLHYPYVKHLADGQGLPVAGRDRLLKQEATQGPLFYALAALATFWLETDDLESLLDYNPHWPDTTVRPLHDNQNLIAHGPADRFPYQGAARAVHLARIVSVLFGTLAVGCTVLIAAALFPGRLWLALGAGGLVAFNPQFIRTSATVSNDAASTGLVALLVFLAWRWAGAYSRPAAAGKPWLAWWQIAFLGALAGFAILAKLNGLIGLGLVGLILLERATAHPPTPIGPNFWGRLVINLTGITLVAGLVAGWWFGRNWQLYGEWTASDIHLNLAGRGHLSLAEIWQLRHEIENTFWASFGWGQIRLPEWVYVVLRWGRYLATAGLALFLVRAWSAANLRRVALLLIWLLVGLGLLLQWISLVGSVSHARLLFPALPAMAILGMLGLGQWLPQAADRRRLALAVGLTGMLFGLSIWSLTGFIIPAYAPPPAIQTKDVPADLPPLQLTYATGLRLLAAEVSPSAVAPGQTATVSLYWQGIDRMDRNYSLFLRLLEADQTVVAARDSYPGLGLLPTKHWPPGKTVRDPYRLTIPADYTAGPTIVTLAVGLYDFHTDERAGLPAINLQGEAVDPYVAQLKILPSAWPEIAPMYPISVSFADQIALSGYDWTCDQACRLTLYWRPTGQPAAPYTVFIQHWLDGEQVAGFDGPPRNGRYPTPWWTAGELIVDRHDLPQLGAGTLLFGLYDPTTGQRVPILGADTDHRDHGVIVEVSAK